MRILLDLNKQCFICKLVRLVNEFINRDLCSSYVALSAFRIICSKIVQTCMKWEIDWLFNFFCRQITVVEVSSYHKMELGVLDSEVGGLYLICFFSVLLLFVSGRTQLCFLLLRFHEMGYGRICGLWILVFGWLSFCVFRWMKSSEIVQSLLHGE